MRAPRAARERGRGALALHQLTKVYGEQRVVDAIALDVAPGEFLTVLGPSGSGKTTTLAMVAGFTRPDGGSISLDEVDLTRVPPHRREIGVVFQNYALFPHMTAAENVAFPLKMRHMRRAAVSDAVTRALAAVHLDGLGGRYPRELSGGQQQRVALARAFVFEPRLLLMDEPLGALDKKLREAMQIEIMRLTRELGITVMYVTHDQEEALVMSDRIAIYNHGRIEQVGSAVELYERPRSEFVAQFMGESNVFHGRARRDGDTIVVSGDAQVRVEASAAVERSVDDGAPVTVVVRPEHLEIVAADGAATPPERGDAGGRIPATVRDVVYLGASRKYLLATEDGGTLTATFAADAAGAPSAAPGASVWATWQIRHGILVAAGGPPGPPLEEDAGDALSGDPAGV